jgi:hypothetical protein
MVLFSSVRLQKGTTTDFLGNPFVYNNSYRVAVGGWYLPNYNDFRNYLNRVVYRYGAFTKKET